MRWAIWRNGTTEPIDIYDSPEQAEDRLLELLAAGEDSASLVMQRYTEHHVGDVFRGSIEITKLPSVDS